MREFLRSFIKLLRSALSPFFERYGQFIPYFLTLTLALAIVVTSINFFIELTEGVRSNALTSFDSSITEYVIAQREPGLTHYFLFVTNIGDFYGYLVVVSIFTFTSAFFFKRWKYVAQTTIVLVLATVSNMVLKRFIARARPGIEHLVSVETLSYPSGHAMSAMAFYGFMIYLFFRFRMNIFLKTGFILLLTLLILSIGISRIYLGVHYPSDILGGYIAGFIWVIFCVVVFDLIELFNKDPKT